jgi:hypothetical protein
MAEVWEVVGPRVKRLPESRQARDPECDFMILEVHDAIFSRFCIGK